jgi:hypothetical protein
MSFAEQQMKAIRRRRRWEAVRRALLIFVCALDVLFVAIGGATVGWWLHGP